MSQIYILFNGCVEGLQYSAAAAVAGSVTSANLRESIHACPQVSKQGDGAAK
jgi:hypothetical protein